MEIGFAGNESQRVELLKDQEEDEDTGVALAKGSSLGGGSEGAKTDRGRNSQKS